MDKPERIDCAVRSARQDDQGVPVLPNSVPVLSDGVAFSPDQLQIRGQPHDLVPHRLQLLAAVVPAALETALLGAVDRHPPPPRALPGRPASPLR